jgi:hypothetical protein
MLAIVPTKGRPKLARRLLRAIWRTAWEPVDIAFIICSSEMELYRRAFTRVQAPEGRAVLFVEVDDDFTYPRKLNFGAAFAPAGVYRFFALLNDDHEPITHGWDVKLKDAIGDERFGVAYGPDGIWDDGTIPSAPVITSSMYEALGWVALPGLHHILVDNVWKDLAVAMGTLHFLPDVRIQHRHRQLGAEDDATYRETNDNLAHQQEDGLTYETWSSAQRALDVAKLEALG